MVAVRKKKNLYKVNEDLVWMMEKSAYLPGILCHYNDKTLDDCALLCELAGDLAGKFSTGVSENDRYAKGLAPGIAQAYKELAEAGFIGMTLMKTLHFPFFTSMAVYELMAQADPALMVRYGLSDGVAETIDLFGGQELYDNHVPGLLDGSEIGAMVLTESGAGSDLRQIITKAVQTEQGIFLSGNKQFISNCDATVHLVLARDAETFKETHGTMKGLSMYLVSSAENAGKVQNTKVEEKLGLHASLTGTIVYDNAVAHLVGKKGAGLEQMLHLMYSARLGVCAQALGVAQAAVIEAQRYAKERHQFGKSLRELPAMANLLEDMSLTLLGMRSLLYEAAYCVDMKTHQPEMYERRARTLTLLSKYYLAEECVRLCRLAVQVHGGSGFMKDYLVEQFARDALVFPIYEGTSQIQALTALKLVGKGGWKAALGYYTGGLKRRLSPERSTRMLGEMEQLVGSALLALAKKGQEGAQFHAERFARLLVNYELGAVVLQHTTRPEYVALKDRFLPRLLASSNKEYDEIRLL
ncbi:acyl-CoA dehydrogenase family protein [Candidatus Woesearchaeota archaeon]|nr:acyl-CoA dehydrogenase family protein [Candidatus Woesearchaeota archaeon]